jgi:predicted Rossmann fold flavoprotein
MMKNNKVIIVGGGAAGMIAAIVAAQNGAKVIILERMNRVGKKILATGNGRCNLTNIYTDIKRFHGKNPKFIYGALSQFSVQQTIDFFEQLGIACKEEEGGKVYPYSDQASSVLDVLRHEMQNLDIEELCEAEVVKIQFTKKEFILSLKDTKTIKCDRVILATGGKASPNLGSNGSGYELAIKLGHNIIEQMPALVQLKLDSQFLKALKGIKFIGEASVIAEKTVLRKEEGEILFTDYGISGPPILQLSRKANEQIYKGKKTYIRLDMFPRVDQEQLHRMLENRFINNPKKSLEFSFVGLLNKRLIPVVLKEAGITDLQKPCGQLEAIGIKKIVKILKEWEIEIIGSQPWMFAQVTAGGVDIKDINPKTMESKIIPRLYFAGEIMDIDGDCGGFNLQWAWSSGYVAGYHAAVD